MANKKNCKTDYCKLYENHLAGGKVEYAVTLDEALVYLNDSNKNNSICYISRGENVSDDWVLDEDKSFSKHFMVVGIITGRGAVPLIRIPSKVKINASTTLITFCNRCLKFIFLGYMERI